MSYLTVDRVAKAFGKDEILKDASLTVGRGEMVAIFGASGAGKTVLLRTIAGFERPSAGDVTVDGRSILDMAPEARETSMAFQNFALYPHMSAFENIASPLRARRVAGAEIGRRVARTAELLRIDHVLHHLPRELSNGQKGGRPWAAPWCESRRSCCSTIPCATWTRSCATRCGSSCRACSSGSTRPSSTSRRTTRRRWRSASGSPCSTTAASSRLIDPAPSTCILQASRSRSCSATRRSTSTCSAIPCRCPARRRPRSVLLGRHPARGRAGRSRSASGGDPSRTRRRHPAQRVHRPLLAHSRQGGGVRHLLGGEGRDVRPVFTTIDAKKALLFDAETGARIAA